MADILTFPRNPGAPVQPLPRPHFGLREAGLQAFGIGLPGAETVRPEDRAEQDRVKAAARAARVAHDTPAPSISLDDIIACTDHLDEVARRARILSIASGKAAFQLVAQDAESLSERLVMLAAQVTEAR